MDTDRELQPTRELVLKKLRDCFPDSDDAREALAVLDSYGTESWHRERERVQLAALKLSDGKLERLKQVVDVAKTDFRDVLMGAEYPEESKHGWWKKYPPDIGEIRKRDRAQYEAWLQSGAASDVK